MNDWWDYLAHSEVGGERKNHKYYARVVLGADKHGNVQYRYFYDAREYGAYKTRMQKGGNADSFGPFGSEKNRVKTGSGRTTFVTGWSNDGKLPDKKLMEQVNDLRATKLKEGQTSLGSKVAGFNITYGGNKRNPVDTKIAMRRASSKTVKNKKPKKSKKLIYQRGKDAVSRLFGHNTKITMPKDMDERNVKKYVANKG